MESEQLLTQLKTIREHARPVLEECEAQDLAQLCTLCTAATIVAGNVHAMLAAVHVFRYWGGLGDGVWAALSVSQACS